MNEADALELLRAGILAVILGSAPAVIAALIVGLTVSLFQALTQIQESTLSFAPKIVAVALALLVASPFIGSQILSFSERVQIHIEQGFR
ncbi:MAG: flagellar biosynthesis protein FliQ [Beijerinckiaceae bacterium]